MAKQFGYLCLAIGLIAFLSEPASAQYRPPIQTVNRVGRFLGHGNGLGYHTCNPGPDVSYYQPWSQKNSYLISQSPEFLARYANELPKSPMELLQSGQTAYGHPIYGAGMGHSLYSQQGYGGQLGGTSVNAEFVPSKRTQDSEAGDSVYDAEGRDSSEKESNVEDRFEREAEAFEGEGNKDPGAIDDADTQESPSDSAAADEEDEITLLLPPMQKPFIPASYSGKR